MNKSVLQYRIEKAVSGGLMFNSKTDFSNSGSIYEGLVDLGRVKNSEEGLKAHLYGLWKLGEDDKDVSRYSNSSKLDRIWTSLGWAGRDIRYEMKIHSAVNAEGKRKGGLIFIAKKNLGFPFFGYLNK
ncbi:MAG: hypothetical protein V1888_00530 [archaeon]